PLAVVIAAACLLLAAWAGVRTAQDRPVIFRQLIAGAVVEALLVVEVVVAAVLMGQGGRPHDLVTFWGYLISVLALLPVAAGWAFAERTRWSSVVLLVVALTEAFLQYRLLQVWGTV
ncbi:MAG TPA: hypothetical protein VGK35_06775, partial [Actinotalea sp.]